MRPALPSPDEARRDARGFTLIELLVAVSVLALIMVIIGNVVSEVHRGWERTVARVSQFREARVAFEVITRNLSQATLNTYWDYDDPEDPQTYLRQSELQFAAGPVDDLLDLTAPAGGNTRSTHGTFFQAPLGFSTDEDYRQLGTMLNARGYYIEFGGDLDEVPAFVQDNTVGGYVERRRFRLMQFMPPAEENLIYAHDPRSTDAANPARDFWYNNADLISRYSRPVANNILALILTPRNPTPDGSTWTGSGVDPDALAVAPQYHWDSALINNPGSSGPSTQHLLPPLVDVTLVAIDERSAFRLEQRMGDGAAAALTDIFDGTLFQFATNHDADLETLTTALGALDLDYRVFSSTVTMRASKWGEQ